MAGRCHKSRRRGCECDICFLQILGFFLVGYYTILNKFSGEGKRPDLHSQNYSGPDNVCKNRSRCSPVLKRITGP